MDNKSAAGIDRRGFFASIGAALLAPLTPLGKLDFGGKFSVESAGNAVLRPMAAKLCTTALPAVGSAGAFALHESWSGMETLQHDECTILDKFYNHNSEWQSDEPFQSFSINTDEVT